MRKIVEYMNLVVARQRCDIFSNRTNGHTQVYPDYVQTRTNVTESRTSSSSPTRSKKRANEGKDLLVLFQTVFRIDLSNTKVLYWIYDCLSRTFRFRGKVRTKKKFGWRHVRGNQAPNNGQRFVNSRWCIRATRTDANNKFGEEQMLGATTTMLERGKRKKKGDFSLSWHGRV